MKGLSLMSYSWQQWPFYQVWDLEEVFSGFLYETSFSWEANNDFTEDIRLGQRFSIFHLGNRKKNQSTKNKWGDILWEVAVHMVVYYRITNSHADYYDVSVIPIAAFRRHVLWWADYQLQGNLSQTSCLNVALRTTFSMNRHMQALNILLIIIFILGAIVDTYATHKTKKYSWHFMSFLCFLLVFIISIVFYSKEDFVFYLGTSASIVCAITSGYKLFTKT